MKTASYVTTGAALQMVTLFGLAYATDSHLPGISPMAAVSIFIDGTKDILPTNDPQGDDRMKGALAGKYDQGHIYDAENPTAGGNVFIDYPREFGIMTGLGSHSYDESRTIAATKTKAAIIDALEDNPGEPVYVVGFSQGSNAASDVLADLEGEGYDTSKVTFVLLGNGARNDGGLWARLPAGVYVPLIGLSFGQSTNPSTDPNAPQVILVSKQYDGASDVPKYVMNPLAWANAALGFLYVHNGYYNDVDISDLDTDGDGKLSEEEIAEAPDDYVITTNGNIVDVLIKNKVGDLPLTRPLLDLGVPREVVEAIDPLLRAIIETSYDRPTDGVYSAKPVHLGLMPDPHQWVEDFHAIAEGMKQTEENLEELNHANLINPPAPQPQPFVADDGEGEEGEQLAAKQAVVPTQTSKPYTVVPTQQMQPAAVTPTPAVVPPPATPTPVPPAEVQQTANVGGAPAGGEGTAPTTSKPQVNINKSLQQINKAITGTVKTVVGALTPKKKTTTPTTGTTDPGPETTGGSTPDNDPPSQDPGNEAPAA